LPAQKTHCQYTQDRAQINLLPDIEAGKEEKLVPRGKNMERMGEEEGLNVAETFYKRLTPCLTHFATFKENIQLVSGTGRISCSPWAAEDL
jgi:hypothetical protein